MVYKFNYTSAQKHRLLSLQADSSDYFILKSAVYGIKTVPGLICEIGTRKGGSLAIIVDSLLENNDYNRNIVFIDPYGNIQYNSADSIITRYDYTNNMRNNSLCDIYFALKDLPVNVIPFILEDTEFFEKFHSGVPIYSEVKTIENIYSLVFFDGPHCVPSITKEVEFFSKRSIVGTTFVFDDISWYNHKEIEQILTKNNFVCLQRTNNKISYKRIV